MNKFKTAALTSTLLMAFGVVHAQTAGGAQGLDNSAAPSPGIQSVEETGRAMKGDAMRPQESTGDMKNEKSMDSNDGSSGASGAAGTTGSSGSASDVPGTARGLDNSGTQSVSPSPEGVNSVTKGDALRPQKPAGQ